MSRIIKKLDSKRGEREMEMEDTMGEDERMLAGVGERLFSVLFQPGNH